MKNISHLLFKTLKAGRYAMAFIAAAMTLSLSAAATETDSKKILLVISGNGKDGGKTKPGYEFGEFASAYLVFKNNGLAVDVASPVGGKVEPDAYNPNDTRNALVLADEVIMAKLNNSLAMSSIKASDYDAVLVIGGKGAMFDLPTDKKLQSIIGDIYQTGGIVSAVCHGPAALVNVKLNNGDYLVKGKKVNGFTNLEENLFGQKWINEFDFLLEDKLKARGGQFQSSPMMLSHVAKDGRLITGQNPTSTPAVAEAVVRSLGLTPVARTLTKDEATLAMIEDFLGGDQAALTAFKSSPADYNGRLAGVYGFYHSKSATTEAGHRQAIALMMVEPKMMANPALKTAVAKAWLAIGDQAQAKILLTEIVKDHPTRKKAADLLATID